MKQHSAEEYNEWIKISEDIGGLAKLDGEAGEAPPPHGPANPAVYAYGTEAEKAHYEQLKQKPEDAIAKEFLNLYIYGGEEGEE